jgi:hypothetical protein
MKKILYLASLLLILFLSPGCKKDSSDTTVSSTSISGAASPMSVVGTTVSSTTVPVAGVSGLTASVASVANGVSSYSGSGVITNSTIKNLLSNYPDFTIHGDTVSVTGFKIKQTVEGIECQNSMGPGIVVRYASNVGDTYPVGSTGRTRTVVSKSTTDDYYYGFYLIKVIKVEEPMLKLKSGGLSKVTYWANHKFGLVGVKYDFADGSSATFPVYCNTSNEK